ncbi:hypothetical protein DW966_16045, partial [Bacteroides stercoris]
RCLCALETISDAELTACLSFVLHSSESPFEIGLLFFMRASTQRIKRKTDRKEISEKLNKRLLEED